MPEQEFAQIYLATPSEVDLDSYLPQLASVLDAVPVACVRIALSTEDSTKLGRAADHIRDICHAREVAVVIDGHFRLVTHHGLDGVHLHNGERLVREAREMLGKDRIVGTYCKASKHSGMNAAEAGADYISFGPAGDMGALGDGSRAEPALFEWWSEMIEVPVVAEGHLDEKTLISIRDFVDFVTFGDEIWQAESPSQAARRWLAILEGA